VENLDDLHAAEMVQCVSVMLSGGIRIARAILIPESKHPCLLDAIVRPPLNAKV
jgi:hypothetical protein